MNVSIIGGVLRVIREITVARESWSCGHGLEPGAFLREKVQGMIRLGAFYWT